MPIELLDKLRAVVHNMGWLDEGGDEQLAYLAAELLPIADKLREVIHVELGMSPEQFVLESQDFLESF